MIFNALRLIGIRQNQLVVVAFEERQLVKFYIFARQLIGGALRACAWILLQACIHVSEVEMPFAIKVGSRRSTQKDQ